MTLGAGCPRCPSPVEHAAGSWRCPDHGSITPLWRPETADYETFAEHVALAGSMPTFVPWPLSPSWTVTDFGCVAVPDREGRACVMTCSGPTDLDGVVEVTVVSEEPGVGLGARCAGLLRTDPGGEIGEGPPHAKVRIDGHPISLWSVLTCEDDVAFDRSVFAGEAHGRWLWLVLRPASSALLLKDEWILVDLAQVGPALIDLPFGGSPPAW
jgi:hypothetical protein